MLNQVAQTEQVSTVVEQLKLKINSSSCSRKPQVGGKESEEELKVDPQLFQPNYSESQPKIHLGVWTVLLHFFYHLFQCFEHSRMGGKPIQNNLYIFTLGTSITHQILHISRESVKDICWTQHV